jgi:hypothetical protein
MDIGDQFKYMSEKELKNSAKSKEYIFSLFTRKLYAELYFAWCKDCKETFSPDSAKYFSWEQFFTDLLCKKTKGTYMQYSKEHIARFYLQDKNVKKILDEIED